jgi:molecular chaperone GrpE
MLADVSTGTQDESDNDDAAPLQVELRDDRSRVVELQERLEGKERKLQELMASFRHDVAQMVEEAKARLARDADNQLQVDRARLIEGLLPVLDNLELAHASGIRHHADRALINGIILVEQQFIEKLEALGVKRFASLGTRFDPALHHAAGTVPALDAASDGVVLSELQPGYSLGDRLIRPALVLVGRG